MSDSTEHDDEEIESNTPVTDGDICVGEIQIWHYLRGDENEFYVGWAAYNPMTNEQLRVTEAMGIIEAAKFDMQLFYRGLRGHDDDDQDDE